MSDAQYTSKPSPVKTDRKRNERLKVQRLKKNWTQVYVATRIGTSDVEVSRWENGAALPTLYFREKLCALFHSTPEALGFLASPETAAEKRATHFATFFPRPLTSLIGRESEVVTICSLLHQPTVHLLTLTGPGGVGKTHLALHSANTLQASFSDEACFVSLAHLRDATQVLPTIAQALRLQEHEMHSPLERLKTFLHDKDLLLVLDNFEHVVEAASALIELLVVCPRLKMLVTSREGLDVRGEQELVIQPLALPDQQELPDHELLLQYGAVALFLERAREIIPDIALTSATVPLITEICRRLDGLPLAIELAASQLKLFQGIGDVPEEFKALGLPDLSVRQRQERLEEIIQVVKALWSGQPVSFTGKHLQVQAQLQAPSSGGQQPAIPLLLAGGGERQTLRQVATYADVSNFGAHRLTGAAASLEDVKRKYQVLQTHCQQIGRDPQTILRSYLTMPFLLGKTPQALARKQEALPVGVRLIFQSSLVALQPQQAIDYFRGLIEAGIQYAIVGVALQDIETLELLRTEVWPALSSDG